jgi:hypothetical protein
LGRRKGAVVEGWVEVEVEVGYRGWEEEDAEEEPGVRVRRHYAMVVLIQMSRMAGRKGEKESKTEQCMYVYVYGDNV